MITINKGDHGRHVFMVSISCVKSIFCVFSELCGFAKKNRKARCDFSISSSCFQPHSKGVALFVIEEEPCLPVLCHKKKNIFTQNLTWQQFKIKCNLLIFPAVDSFIYVTNIST